MKKIDKFCIPNMLLYLLNSKRVLLKKENTQDKVANYNMLNYKKIFYKRETITR